MRRTIAYAIGFVSLLIAAAAVALTEDDPLAPYLWEARPIVVFADSEKDPRFVRQMENFIGYEDEFAERDVVILTDTDPSALSALRKRLRPRGFQVVLIDKDGEIKYRTPHPVEAEFLNRTIDRMPMRRREMRGGQS